MRQTTVVLPCLNEAETLAGCIVEAQRSYHAADLHGSVLVADDNGSTDASSAIAIELHALVVQRGCGVSKIPNEHQLTV
jgi:glycosyltransferase involved in cell wall biosynthesis